LYDAKCKFRNTQVPIIIFQNIVPKPVFIKANDGDSGDGTSRFDIVQGLLGKK
jgi:hypothetical protein